MVEINGVCVYSLAEAAEYISAKRGKRMALQTLKRHVETGRLKPLGSIGRDKKVHLYAEADLDTLIESIRPVGNPQWVKKSSA